MAKFASWLDQSQPSGEAVEHQPLLQRSRAIVRMVDSMRAAGTPLSKKAEFDYVLAKAVVEREEQRLSTTKHMAAALPAGKDQEQFLAATRMCRVIIRVVERLRQSGEPMNEQAIEEYNLALQFMDLYNIARE